MLDRYWVDDHIMGILLTDLEVYIQRVESNMARKTNYSFERNQRAKAKAAKREAKRQAKLATKAEPKTTPEDDATTESSQDATAATKTRANGD
jgi:hypothetical protein